MLDEEQISFRSASLMFDGVEDYSHQIAEMIGLRNESNFIQAGVNEYLTLYFLWWLSSIISYFTTLIHINYIIERTPFRLLGQL